jgi:hypothetical protein
MDPPAMLWHFVLTQEVMKNDDSKEVNSDDNKLQGKIARSR